MEEKNIVAEMTAVMREADKLFETVGGSTRHYVRDVLLPLMEKNGLKIIQEPRDLDGVATAISQDVHEKEVMMQAFDRVRQLFEGRQWIMEGRGSYPYNDERYKEEVRYMYDEFDAIQKDTWENIESKSFEYRKAIVEAYVKGTAAGREEDAVSKEVIDFIRDIATNWDCDSDGHKYDTGCRKCEAKKLYELFKQQKDK